MCLLLDKLKLLLRQGKNLKQLRLQQKLHQPLTLPKFPQRLLKLRQLSLPHQLRQLSLKLERDASSRQYIG